MSEFVEIQTNVEIKDASIEEWDEALKLLGYLPEIATTKEGLPLFGFQNDMRDQRVMLRISRNQLKAASNDAGVYMKQDGTLGLYLSKYDMDSYSQNEAGELVGHNGIKIKREQCTTHLRKLWFDLPEKIKEVMQKNKVEVMMEASRKALKKLGYTKFIVRNNVLEAVKISV